MLANSLFVTLVVLRRYDGSQQNNASVTDAQFSILSGDQIGFHRNCMVLSVERKITKAAGRVNCLDAAKQCARVQLTFIVQFKRTLLRASDQWARKPLGRLAI